MIDSRAEKIGDRPVLEHEEDVVVSSLAKTSLRGPEGDTDVDRQNGFVSPDSDKLQVGWGSARGQGGRRGQGGKGG